MTEAPLAVFRCDASYAMGGGHVMRCLAIAEWLQEAGWACAFAARPGTAQTVPALSRAGLPTLSLDGPEADEPAAMTRNWPAGAELLVVDHYGREAAFEAPCRPWAKAIVAIEDLAGRRHDCDVLIAPVPDAAAAEGEGHGRRLSGPTAVPLRRQFARARAGALARRKAGDGVRRLLVSFGASDPLRMTERAIAAASACLPGVAIDVLLGAGSEATAERLGAFATAAGVDVHVHRDVDDVTSLLSQADIGVGAAGVSSWERACLGLPSVVVAIADNQVATATLLGREGAAVDLGFRTGDRATGEMSEAVWALAASAAARRGMAERAARLCDGRGCLRLMLALLPGAQARDTLPVSLRLAEMGDLELMYSWQRAPETRRYARVPQPPTPAEHSRWLTERLEDDATILCIINHGGVPAGVLRFDTLLGKSSREVSILVAPERFGRGIGRAALDLGRRLLPGAPLEAEVLPDNAASHRLFQGAGFRPLAPGRYLSPGVGRADQ